MTDFNHCMYRVSFNFIQIEEKTRSIISKQFLSYKFWQLEFYSRCWKISESLSVSKCFFIFIGQCVLFHKIKLSVNKKVFWRTCVVFWMTENNFNVYGLPESFI